MNDNTKPSVSGKYLTVETWDALKAAGFTEADLQADQPMGPIIFSYTRAQAIEDGVLVDLMQPETEPLVREAGFRFPIAMTAAAFSEAVAPIDGELPPGQDLKGRLWDVLMLLKAAIRAYDNTDRIHFTVSVFDGTKTNPVQLWALCGPGDDLEPVITLMLESED
jgi:hypothetical protein